MKIYDELIEKRAALAVVGLGYVGLPLAVAFGEKLRVIGYDKNPEKVRRYQEGHDVTGEAGDEALQKSGVQFTADAAHLAEASFFVIAVPTPVNVDKTPDISLVEAASATVARCLRPGGYVVYESTVYPGVTEDLCVPVLERESGLVCGRDFFVGYSPERINPGDRVHTLKNITKIVSGMDEESLNAIAAVYALVIEAGIYKAASIKVAEAAKVVENSQRDINIAFMNELAMVFGRMGIDTMDVVDAMNTKWNALGFVPGLVGGHCIGVDPYYFIYEAEQLGYHSQIVLSGRKINDGMAGYVADTIVKKLVLRDRPVASAKVVILGVTFKENCPDSRNTKVADIVTRLAEYGIRPLLVDPEARPDEFEKEYGLRLSGMDEVKNADCLVFAVAHSGFIQQSPHILETGFKDLPMQDRIVIDVKSVLDKEAILAAGYTYWRM